jgi:hypothetical protein
VIRSSIGSSAFALCLGVCLHASFAHADTPPADRAAAQALFEEGRTLMQAGKLAEACGRLEKSEELDPGGGTMLNLAVCHEKQGRTATAWAEFHDALDMARRDKREEREDFALKHIAAIEPELSRLTIKVPIEGAPQGLEILRNGSPLKRAAWSTATPLDPGPQTIVARAPGYAAWSTTITLGEHADAKTVEVPSLTRAGEAQPVGPGPSPGRASAGAQRPIGFALLGLGAATLGVGAGFGVHALSSNATAHTACMSDSVCPPGSTGLATSKDAVTSAKVADGLIFGGIGLVGVGLVIALTARPAGGDDKAPSAALVAGPGRVRLALAF